MTATSREVLRDGVGPSPTLAGTAPTLSAARCSFRLPGADDGPVCSTVPRCWALSVLGRLLGAVLAPRMIVPDAHGSPVQQPLTIRSQL
jgi:hypothetical protein